MSTAKDVLDRAREVLNDKAKVRWTDAKLLLWVSDALDLLFKARPDLFIVRGSHTCTAGARQTLTPSRAVALLEVVGLRRGDKGALDDYRPGWQSGTAGTASEWMLAGENPKAFLLYPPSANGQTLTVAYLEAPAELTADTDVLPVPDDFVGCFADYAVGMAETKDAEYVVAARAQAFLSAFAQKLGLTPAAAAPKK